MVSELVSIVVPIYNTEAYLPKCLDSLTNQTYPEIEIILVNDGSTDASLQICNNYAQQYSNITVINQTNKGVSAARNQGIKVAKGEYLTFVDSDDELCSDAIELMHRIITDRSADIVSASMTGDVYPKMIDKVSLNMVSGLQTVQLALKEVSLSACAKLFRKESITGIFFTEGKKVNEDGFFVFECYMRQLKVVETNQIVYIFSRREGSSSRECFSDKFLDMLYFVERKKQYVENYYPQYIRQLLFLETRTNLNLLQLLCFSNEEKYDKYVNLCCARIRENPCIDTSLCLKYEKRLYCAVRLRMYGVYKFLINNFSKRRYSCGK